MSAPQRFTVWMVVGVLCSLLLLTNLILAVRLIQARWAIDSLEARHEQLVTTVHELEQRLNALQAGNRAVPAPAEPTAAGSAGEAAARASAPVEAEPPSEGLADRPVAWADVRAYVSEALEERFPDLQLSEADKDELASAVMQLREARAQMRALPFYQRYAPEHQELRDQVLESDRTFQRLTHMRTSEFLRAAGGDGGIDRAASPDEDVELEYLRKPGE